MRKLSVSVDGKVYEVLVELDDEASGGERQPPPATVPGPASPPPAPAPTPAAAPFIESVKTKPAPAGSGNVGSPLPGKVVSIDVKVGDAVAEGAQLVTLEAMKMNTFVNAPHAGKVMAVHVSPGDAVDEGAALVSLG